MFRIVFAGILCLVLTSSSFCQKDSLIQYKGGLDRLNGDVLRHLRIDRDLHDEGKVRDHYYLVMFDLQKNNTVGPRISIVSVMDSGKAGALLAAFKFTKDKWINLSGEDQTVVLPIYIHYKFDDPNAGDQDIPAIRQDYYINWEKKKIICLKPMIITSLPAVR